MKTYDYKSKFWFHFQFNHIKSSIPFDLDPNLQHIRSRRTSSSSKTEKPTQNYQAYRNFIEMKFSSILAPCVAVVLSLSLASASAVLGRQNLDDTPLSVVDCASKFHCPFLFSYDFFPRQCVITELATSADEWLLKDSQDLEI